MQQESPWYVVLTEPQQEMTTVWRLHDLGLELFVPIVRTKKATGRKDIHGRKIVVMRPRPMFPGYAFLRTLGVTDLNKIRDIRGVRDFYCILGKPVTLPDEAIRAVLAKQRSEHEDFLRAKGVKESRFKKGDKVRFDEGSPYAGLVAEVDKIDSKGRIELLLAMVRYKVPADMVVAA